MTFPTTWPQGCPPDDASNEPIHAYRISKSNPPELSDFETFWESGRAKSCRACGLSLLQSREAAKHHINLFPKAGHWIADVLVGGGFGRWANTPSKTQPLHLTWWVPESINRMDAIQETFSA